MPARKRGFPLAWAFCVSGAIALACGGRAVAPASPASPAPRAEPRLVGRFDRSDAEHPRFAWSASTVEARFEGRGIAVLLRVPPVRPELTKAGETKTPYRIAVDDGAPFAIAVESGVERYELARGLSPGRHTAIVTRESEADAGVHQLLGFDVEGGALLPPPPPRAHRIEILGDSITCGYGVLGADAHCPFAWSTERASLAYGWIAARALDADLVTVCGSGRGVVRNYDGGTRGLVPELYELAIPEPPTPFDFASSPEPNAVVLAVGTNDFLGGGGAPLDLGAFESAYAKLLARVREVRPRALVVVATSPMLGPDPASSSGGGGPVRDVARASFARIVAARRSAGDARVELLDFDYQGGRLGCDYHPNAEMHRVLGAELAAFLRGRL